VPDDVPLTAVEQPRLWRTGWFEAET